MRLLIRRWLITIVSIIDQQTIPDESVQYYLKIANEKGSKFSLFDITTDPYISRLGERIL